MGVLCYSIKDDRPSQTANQSAIPLYYLIQNNQKKVNFN